MPHDDFENERDRIEHVLEILERTAERLDARKHVPLTMLRDAVTFLRRAEDAAYEAAQMDDGEPASSACLDHHAAARQPLAAMQDALGALEVGVASAAARFAHGARLRLPSPASPAAGRPTVHEGLGPASPEQRVNRRTGRDA